MYTTNRCACVPPGKTKKYTLRVIIMLLADDKDVYIVRTTIDPYLNEIIDMCKIELDILKNIETKKIIKIIKEYMKQRLINLCEIVNDKKIYISIFGHEYINRHGFTSVVDDYVRYCLENMEINEINENVIEETKITSLDTKPSAPLSNENVIEATKIISLDLDTESSIPLSNAKYC